MLAGQVQVGTTEAEKKICILTTGCVFPSSTGCVLACLDYHVR